MIKMIRRQVRDWFLRSENWYIHSDRLGLHVARYMASFTPATCAT
ncbi:hypothetical protein [Leptothermofonsia sp. ETS-13]